MQRFWDKVNKNAPNGCWNWTATTVTRTGTVYYGRFSLNGKVVIAHRVAWELENGPIPEKMLVLHKCDNGLCVNPDHLFLGTQRDNMLDMYKKGRGKGMLGRKMNDKTREALRIANEKKSALSKKAAGN